MKINQIGPDKPSPVFTWSKIQQYRFHPIFRFIENGKKWSR